MNIFAQNVLNFFLHIGIEKHDFAKAALTVT